MAVTRILLTFVRLIGFFIVGLLNLILLWNFSGIRHQVKIENDSTTPVFQVVAMDSGKAELFLSKEELNDYLRTHPNYSFLLSVGQDQVVQDQIVASYNAKFGKNGGKGYPTFKLQTIDANHQYVELYMHGDPHDFVFWYEASDKQIEPRYYMIFSAFHLVIMTALALVMTAVEYRIGVRLVRKRTARSIRGGA